MGGVVIPPHLAKTVRLDEQRLRWIGAYFEEAGQNPTEAARIAGYAEPYSAGSKLVRKLSQVLEYEARRRQEAKIAGPIEVLEILSEIARSSTHKDQRGAAQDLAKIHGLLSDRLVVETDRSKLVEALKEQLTLLGSDRRAALKASEAVIDIEADRE